MLPRLATLRVLAPLPIKNTPFRVLKLWCEQSTSPAIAVSPRNPAGSRPFANKKKHPFGC